jgi:murein L,D-transpeptidase YcbB/YkuD
MTLSAARRPVLLGLLSVAASPLLSLGPSGAAQAAVTAYRQAVAEAVSGDEVLAAFYRGRDYEPLWMTADAAPRRAAFFAALDHARYHGLPVARYDAAGLFDAFLALQSERQRGLLEVAVSRSFLAYATDARNGFIDPASADPGIVREVPRRDPLALIRGFANASPRAFLKGLLPQSQTYAGLVKAARTLEGQIAAGGWGAEVAAGALAPGDGGPAVVALRDRLIALRYLRPTAQPGYDGALQKAVQQFQLDHGITADGIAGEGTIAEINASPETRLQSVFVAMERLRWMNGLELGARHIWVNLPDFTAKIVDDGKVTFETVTVVGMNQADRRSPEFSDRMEFMVVNPTWNVPRSITVKEYLPMLQKNPNAAGHLRIVDRRGRLVDRGSVDFTQFSASNFPFSMSQPPSDGNALGRVKFMFPNQYNIYLHDTPSKDLFNREVRAFSHGCIRLGRPFEFAYALLARQTNDPVGEFEAHLATRGENTIPLKDPVPVHLVYFTAWPSPKGKMTYRRDVYGRDGRIFAKMQEAGVALPTLQG